MCHRAAHLDRQKIEKLKKEAGVQSPHPQHKKSFKKQAPRALNLLSAESAEADDSPRSGNKKQN